MKKHLGKSEALLAGAIMISTTVHFFPFFKPFVLKRAPEKPGFKLAQNVLC